MKILYLSKNADNYRSANYQKEFLKSLSKITSLFVYGPGYSYFNKKKKIKDIINSYGPFDIIFIGHLWLNDGKKNQIDPWPNSGLSKIKKKKFFFLNKEYTNLEKKLKWIKRNRFDCVFSHHQNCKVWENIAQTPIKYLPFGYNDKFFYYSKNNKKYDLSFSGVLQNSHGNKVQSDIRIRILNRLYHTIFNIPIFKKKRYRHLSIFWNSIPTTFIGQVLARLFKTYKFLDIKTYAKMQKESKVYLNCKSPLNLISPRYFENIASGCLIITEKNNFLKKILPKFSYIEFNNNLNNFDKALYKSLDNFETSKKRCKDAALLIKKKHSWTVRVKECLKIIKSFIK